MTNIDAQAVINLAEPLILDAIGWFRRRTAESGTMPDDNTVVAYVKGKLAGVVREADAFEAEGDAPLTPAPAPVSSAGGSGTGSGSAGG